MNTIPLPLQQALSGERIYIASILWSSYGRFPKIGWTGQDDVSDREERLAKEYGDALMILSMPGTGQMEKWLHHQFALERLTREQTGKTKGWHPTELYWCSDRIAAWVHGLIDSDDTSVRIECSSREIAHRLVTELYQERWNRRDWHDEAA